jgi:septal ring factor EnvC (AmiA/AmiB activator)
MTKRAGIFLLISLLLAGCRGDIAELEKKVLERDPSFRSVLDAKSSMLKELEGTRKKYSERRLLMEGQIAALRQEMERSRGEYTAKIERTKKKLEPEITALKNEIKATRRAAAVKNSELRVIEKNISEIKELVQKGKNLEMTQEEMRMWNERMTALLKKRESALKERDKMIFDAETNELKIKILEAR